MRALLLALSLLILWAVSTSADNPRPCVLAVLGEQPAAYIAQYVVGVRKGDYIVSRECYQEVTYHGGWTPP